MPGPVPKPAKTRQRRNRSSTNATLPTTEEALENEVPELHKRDDGSDWHPMVLAWWQIVWTSPMASEYLEPDRFGLYLVADLHQRRWTAESNREVLEMAKEIRLQEVRFGLSPIDRRRLQWEVARTEKVVKRKAAPAPEPGTDPRKALKAI